MRFTVLLLLAAITTHVVPPASGQASATPPAYHFASDGASLVRIPIEVVADRLVFVQAKVNGHKAWFIVDNAVQGFVIDRDYAKRAALMTSGGALTHGEAPGATEAGIIRDVQISLPGFDLTHRVLIAIDLKTLEPAVGHEVNGIIGSRLFDDFIVALVNYERHWLSIYAPGQYRPTEDGKALPVQIDEHGFQFLDATIALPRVAPITGTFLIDSGANSYADIYKPFGDAHQLPPATMNLLDAPGTSAGATTRAKDGRAERLEVGAYSIRNPPITFGEDAEGLMAAKDYAGLIGAGFLQRFTVVYDSRGKRIWLTPNRSYEDPAEYDESGLRIRAEGADFHRFVVTRIVPQSPAAAAGIEPGDAITTIDGRSAQELTLTELREMLRRPKARYTIGLMRHDKRITVALELRPLL